MSSKQNKNIKCPECKENQSLSVMAEVKKD